MTYKVKPTSTAYADMIAHAKRNQTILAMHRAATEGTKDLQHDGLAAFPPYDIDTQPELWQAYAFGALLETERMRFLSLISQLADMGIYVIPNGE